MHLQMCTDIAENVTGSAVTELTRPSSHRHFQWASWGIHTSCSFYVPFDTSSLPIKTGNITVQTFLPGNGAIFVSESGAVIHTALSSRAVRPETRQMPILALLPLWITDAFTYWQAECQFCFCHSFSSYREKSSFKWENEAISFILSNLTYQQCVVNAERFHRKHWQWSKTCVSDNSIKYTLNISSKKYFCFLGASSFGNKISPSKLHLALPYNLLTVHFFRETKILFWPHLEMYPLVKWGQAIYPSACIWRHIHFLLQKKKKGYLILILNMSARLFYQFLYNICEVLSS